MGAAAVVLFVAGFSVYALVSPALGVVLWVAALLTAVAGVVVRITGRKSKGSGTESAH